MCGGRAGRRSVRAGFHRAMVRLLDQPGPIAVLNIGGVANITLYRWVNELIACDVGPGNAVDR